MAVLTKEFEDLRYNVMQKRERVKQSRENDPKEFVFTTPEVCFDLVAERLTNDYYNSNLAVHQALLGLFGVDIRDRLIEQLQMVIGKTPSVKTVRLVVPEHGLAYLPGRNIEQDVSSLKAFLQESMSDNGVKVETQIVNRITDYQSFNTILRMCIDYRLFTVNVIELLVLKHKPFIFGNAGSVAIIGGRAGEAMQNFVLKQLVTAIDYTSIKDLLVINHHKCAFYRTENLGLSDELKDLAFAAHQIKLKLEQSGIFDVDITARFQDLDLDFFDVRPTGIYKRRD